jgi:hypothetical protein
MEYNPAVHELCMDLKKTYDSVRRDGVHDLFDIFYIYDYIIYV